MNQVDGKQVVNPDESLAELIHQERRLNLELRNYQNGTNANRMAIAGVKAQLTAVRARIEKVEKAAMTGGMVRIF